MKKRNLLVFKIIAIILIAMVSSIITVAIMFAVYPIEPLLTSAVNGNLSVETTIILSIIIISLTICFPILVLSYKRYKK